MVGLHPGEPGDPGVTAVRADHQARAALPRRRPDSGDPAALAQQAVHGYPHLDFGACLRGRGRQDRVKHRTARCYRARAWLGRWRAVWLAAKPQHPIIEPGAAGGEHGVQQFPPA
jgi:hypothetical protein